MLGLFPYTRSYLRLGLPVAGSLAVLLVLHRWLLNAVHPQWLVLGIGLVLAYMIFVVLALAVGLDSDDRLITGAVWARVRGMFNKAEVSA